jgi:YidC/Oxa1 family membrane protein insertase
MNKNSIVGFILIAAIMVGYSIWMSPSEAEIAAKKREQDSIAQVMKMRQDSVAKFHAKEQKAQEAVKQALPAASPQKKVATEVQVQKQAQIHQNEFTSAMEGVDSVFTIETDLAKYTISTKGGFIKSVELKKYVTYDSLPLILYKPETSQFGLSFFSGNKVINTKNLYFEPVTKNIHQHLYRVNGTDSLRFSMRVYPLNPQHQPDRSRYVEFVYVIRGNDYMMHFNINLFNLQGVIPANMNYVELNWYADMLQQERTVDRFNGSTIYYKYYKDDVDYLSESKDDEKQIKSKLKWISFKQRFFSASLIAHDYFNDGVIKTFEIKDHKPFPRYLKSMDADLSVPFNVLRDTHIPLSLYFGPNEFTTLKKYGMELEHQIPIGWSFFLLAWINEYIVIPVFNILGGLGWNYGIVILVLTVLLKIFLFPIAYKTYMSSAKMRVLKPEVDAINAKFPKKEDSMKKQQAVMALYKKAGANPASGCVPMLLQMPILFAMFRFFPAAIQLRQQSFLWATDLSSYDSIFHLPWNIPFYGDHVSLFTLLMTVSTIMYTYLNNQMMGSQQQAMPGMKTMMYLMPIMFLGIFNNYASGLSYYYFLANIITFGQMYVFRYAVNEDKLRKQIESNKKKPVKKSSFQKRLEEAAKQRGYQK